jgi:hypothetical protein
MRPRRSRARCLGPLLLLLSLLLPAAAHAAADRIELELWFDLDPIVQEGAGQDVAPLAPETAVRRLLEEARVIVSGMVYGYAFSYTPSDEARQVAERFDLTPRAEIPWGDPALRVAGTRLDGHRLHVLIRYELSPDQRDWRDAWRSGVVDKAAGEGTGNMFKGYAERVTALTNALKESVRNHLRPRVLNKPREVVGEILIWDVPGTYVDSGAYHTRVTTRLRVNALTPYRVY